MRVDALIFIPFLTHAQETVTYIGSSVLENTMALDRNSNTLLFFFKATKPVSTNHLKLNNYFSFFIKSRFDLHTTNTQSSAMSHCEMNYTRNNKNTT